MEKRSRPERRSSEAKVCLRLWKVSPFLSSRLLEARGGSFIHLARSSVRHCPRYSHYTTDSCFRRARRCPRAEHPVRSNFAPGWATRARRGIGDREAMPPIMLPTANSCLAIARSASGYFPTKSSSRRLTHTGGSTLYLVVIHNSPGLRSKI